MSFHIIIRKDGSRASSKSGRTGFTPHWNHAIDKKPIFIATKGQFDRELGKRGLELVNPDKDNREHTPKSKSYIPSKEGIELNKAIISQGDKNGNLKPTGSLTQALIKRGVIKKRSDVERMLKDVPRSANSGGFSNRKDD